MTDEELIIYYLDSQYTAIINDNNITYQNKFDNSVYEIFQLENELLKIFKGLTKIAHVLNTWVNKICEPYVIEFKNFLKECRLILGDSNWEVIHPIMGKLLSLIHI